MSSEPQVPPAAGSAAEEESRSAPRYRWYHKVSALIFIVFCLEIGSFLVIFPWSEWWDSNFFSALVPEWHRYWENSYLRGAVSGIGVINLYISFVEIFRLRRFSKRS